MARWARCGGSEGVSFASKKFHVEVRRRVLIVELCKYRLDDVDPLVWEYLDGICYKHRLAQVLADKLLDIWE